MATFDQLRANVETWLRDLPADTVAQVPSLINEAIRDLARSHNFRCMEATTTFTTTAATRTLGTIQNFKEPRADPTILGNDNSITRINWQPSLDYLADRYEEDSDGRPAYIYWSAVSGANLSTFQVFPLSDGLSDWVGGEYRIVAPHWVYLPTLVATTDTNWFTVNADKYIRFHAVGIATLLNIDEGRGATYLALAKQEAAELIKRDKRERIVRPDVLRYSTGADQLSSRQRWWSN